MPDLILMNPLYSSQTWSAGNYEHFVLGKDSYIIDNPTGLTITGAFGDRTVLIEGSIVSTIYRGIELGAANPGPNSSSQNHIVIGQEGSITSHDDSINLKAMVTTLTNHGTLNSKLGNAIEAEGQSFWLANHGTMTTGIRHIVQVSGINASIFNTGTMSGNGFGVFLESGGNGTVTNSGQINASTGVYFNGVFNWLKNSGTIQSTSTGATFTDTNGYVVNSGTIESQGSGVSFTNRGTVYNSGTILSAGTAINAGLYTAEYGLLNIVNSGTIQGSTFAIRAAYGGGDGGTVRLLLKNQGEIIGNVDVSTTPDFAAGHVVTNSGTISGDISFGASGDTYKGGKGIISGEIHGNGGNDTLLGGSEDNTFYGGTGDDTLIGRGGDDTLNGGAGEDTIWGGAGHDAIDGGDENDTIRGGAGDDDIQGGSGKDDIRGGAGDDIIDAGSFNDTVRGGAGDDTIEGGFGWDTLIGGAGNDALDGSQGQDLLNGGKGDDILTGGSSGDTFVFGAHDGNDRITDFFNGQDRIDLSALGLSAADYATVVAPALSGAGATVTVLDMTQLGGTGTVRIEGLALADADVSDFIF